jgi:crotonobetaine/carnitine-CoA ligase
MKVYPFEQQTVGAIVEDKAKTCGDRVFLEFEDGNTATYRECDERANRIANGLLQLGLKKGDTLATLLPNCLESLYIWFGTAKAGIIEVPINVANKGTFLSHIINKSDCRMIVIDRELIDRLKFIEKDIPNLQKVIVRSGSSGREPLPELAFEVVNYNVLANASPEPPNIPVKPTDPLVVIYTSGTTGQAKGVLLPNAAISIHCTDYVEAVRGVPEDVLFTFLPLFHGNARFLCVGPALLLETKVVIYKRFSATRFWDQIRKHGATVFNTLGGIANFIYNQPRRPDDGDNPVRVCAAFPMPAPLYDDFEKRYGVKVIEGYGLTETAIITWNPWDAPRIGSCGKEIKTVEVRIVDQDHRTVPPGTLGEIVARGRIPWAMALGYHNMPEKTVELMQNHFYHTGDAGYLDEEGYLFFRDRIKDYIRRRGENISSAEIESVVNSHPKVSMSAAVAVACDLPDDEVKVVVVLKEGERLPPEELLAFCVDRMPYFAVPRYIEYVESLPMTANEKIQKAKLREMGITATTWDREKTGYKVTK